MLQTQEIAFKTGFKIRGTCNGTSQTFLWKKSVPFNFEETYTYYISLESKLAVVSEFQGLEPPFLAIFFKKLNMCEKIVFFYENERENASTRGKQT